MKMKNVSFKALVKKNNKEKVSVKNGAVAVVIYVIRRTTESKECVGSVIFNWS